MGALMIAVGMFSIALGIWHLGVPIWFHFGRALEAGPGPRSSVLGPVRMAPVRYEVARKDVLGVAWIMNAAASYGLITLGLAALAAPAWLGTPVGRVLALWMAGWWSVRAVAQLAISHRRIDAIASGWFGLLALISVGAGLT